MGYQTLYRKYRSRIFSEIVGQEHVVGILKGALSRGRIAHAYMFSGPRGTGKTSIARIFAKALNCPDIKDGEPCGVCHVCTSITEGRSPDVIEMDAASNRGVESIEELRRGVQFVPQELKYKVYIIDEVHMISTAGFNALLKTLEEPPSHAIFVLATTESHKLPITILSRCLRFEFRRIPFKQLAEHLIHITKTEGHVITEDAAHLLAELSEGSARDSISLLDQLIVASGGEITTDFVRSMLGLTHPTAIISIVRKLVDGDLVGLTEDFHQFIVEGRDPEYFLELFYEKMRDGYLGVTDDVELVTLMERIPKRKLLECIETLWEAFGLLRRSNHPSGLIELTLFKLGAIIKSDFEPNAKATEYTDTLYDKSEEYSTITETPSQDFESDNPIDSEEVEREEISDNREPEPASAGRVNPQKLFEQFIKERENGSGVKPDELFSKKEKSPPFPDSAVEYRAKKNDNEADASTQAVEVDDNDFPGAELTTDAYDLPIVETGDHEPEGSDNYSNHPVSEAFTLTPVEKGKRIREAFQSAGFVTLTDGLWNELLERLRKEYLPTYILIRPDIGVVPVVLSESTLYLYYAGCDSLIRSFLRNGRHKRAIESILKEISGCAYDIVYDPCEVPGSILDNERLIKLRSVQLVCLFD